MRHLRLVLAATVGVLFVLVPSVPAHAGGGCHDGTVRDVSGTSVDNTVDLQDMCFVQTILRIKPGQSVTWKNGDQMDHMVTGAGVSWGNLESLRPGRTVSYRFDRAGVYPYACMIHAGMVGAVVVGNGGTPASTSSGGVIPVLTSPSVPAAGTVTGGEAASRAPVSSPGPWRTVALIALGVLVAAAVGIGAQRIGVRRSHARAGVS
jgi:plastocyanin